MSNNWYNTASESDVITTSKAFWAQLAEDLSSGQFWLKNKNTAKNPSLIRLKKGINDLPMPKAYKDAAIAVRALIREKRKNKADYIDELALLYWLAAVASFSMANSDVLQLPGQHVIESMPEPILNNLAFSYDELGYEQLTLLNTTDKKWLVASWGEPNSHSTLLILHKEVWEKYETNLLLSEEIKEDNALEAEAEALTPTLTSATPSIQAIIEEEQSTPEQSTLEQPTPESTPEEPTPEKPNDKKSHVLLGCIIVTIIFYYIFIN